VEPVWINDLTFSSLQNQTAKCYLPNCLVQAKVPNGHTIKLSVLSADVSDFKIDNDTLIWTRKYDSGDKVTFNVEAKDDWGVEPLVTNAQINFTTIPYFTKTFHNL
jgi:hypothetical protein